jgi:hypothetical protein
VSQSTTNFDGVPAFLRAVEEASHVGLLQAGLVVNRQMQRSLSGSSPSSPGSPPGTADGGLRRSIMTVTVAPLHVRVGSNVFYGAVQETGNWGRPIVPVRKKFLLIPLSREARRIYRNQAGSGPGKSARNIPGLKLIPRRGKPPLLVKEQGKTNGARWAWKPLFILKKSVKLPKRPWALPALMATRTQLPGVFASAAGRHLRSRMGAA